MKPSLRRQEEKKLIPVFKEYKRRRCLWDVSNPNYHNPIVRNEAMKHVLRKFQKVDPTATMAYAKMRLLNMRSNYNRQRKKVENSLAAGATGDDVFKPKLWYYPHFSFLAANSDPYTISDSDDEEENVVLCSDDDTADDEEEPHIEENVEESAAAFGRLVGVQVGKLAEMQRWIAEKLISEVLFHAKLSHLTESSTITSKVKKFTESGCESDTSEVVPVIPDIVPKDEPVKHEQASDDGELEEETLKPADDHSEEEAEDISEDIIKIEIDETENAVRFLQMFET